MAPLLHFGGGDYLLVIFGLVIFTISLRDFFLYSAMCHCPLSLSPHTDFLLCKSLLVYMYNIVPYLHTSHLDKHERNRSQFLQIRNDFSIAVIVIRPQILDELSFKPPYFINIFPGNSIDQIALDIPS